MITASDGDIIATLLTAIGGLVGALIYIQKQNQRSYERIINMLNKNIADINDSIKELTGSINELKLVISELKIWVIKNNGKRRD